MSELVSCKCGANVRLPEGLENRRFCCPMCKEGIALTVDAKVLSTSRLETGDPGVVCPICQSDIATGEFTVACPKCDQVHHSECWAEVGGCGTYGCEQAPALEKGDTAAQPPLSAWGDDKSCPACGEKIKAIALKCRYCGTRFDSVDPLTLGDLRRGVHKGEALKSLQKTVIILFILSLVGCLAPLIAIVSACMLLPKRHQLTKEGPVYLVLAYSSIGLSLLYSILMMLFFALGQ